LIILNIPRFRNPLLVLKIVWVTIFLVVLAMMILAIPARIDNLSQDPYGFGPTLWEMGLSVRAFAIYATLFNVLVMLAFLLTSALIFWGKPGDRGAIFASLALLLMGVSLLPLIPALYRRNPDWYIPVQVFRVAGVVMTVNLMYVFPNGRFAPAWTRYSLLGVVSSGLLLFWPGWEPPTVFAEFDQVQDYLIFAILVFWLGTGAYAQIYRYRNASTAVERQQTKWVVLGFILTVMVFLVVLLPLVLFPSLRTGNNMAIFTFAEIPLTLSALLFIPISISLSILRYRLWDIDLIIRRTLVYSSLTISLALVYFGSVVVLQGVISNLFPGGEAPIVTVISTLAVAALFTPLRRRIQDFIDRRFYRQKYNAEKVLVAFSATLRDEVDLQHLTETILGVVGETMQPTESSLWLRDVDSRQ
jgi:hypothetical protein